MLQNQIAKLKSILVVKVISCILITILIIWRLPISYNDLADARVNYNSADASLQNIKQKVQYIKDYRDVVDSVYQGYIYQMQHPTSSCVLTEQLNADYKNLAATYMLQEEPLLYMSPTPIINSLHGSRDVEIFAIIYNLSFASQGFRHAIAFIQEAFKLLPNYGLIYAFEISMRDVITPDSVQRLMVNTKPFLVDSKVAFQVREVREMTQQRSDVSK